MQLFVNIADVSAHGAYKTRITNQFIASPFTRQARISFFLSVRLNALLFATGYRNG